MRICSPTWDWTYQQAAISDGAEGHRRLGIECSPQHVALGTPVMGIASILSSPSLNRRARANLIFAEDMNFAYVFVLVTCFY